MKNTTTRPRIWSLSWYQLTSQVAATSAVETTSSTPTRCPFKKHSAAPQSVSKPSMTGPSTSTSTHTSLHSQFTASNRKECLFQLARMMPSYDILTLSPKWREGTFTSSLISSSQLRSHSKRSHRSYRFWPKTQLIWRGRQQMKTSD